MADNFNVLLTADEIRDAVISATRGDLADRCTAAAE